MTLKPVRFSRLRRLLVGHGRVIPAAGHDIGHIIDVILSGRSLRLKDQIAKFPVDFHPADISNATSCFCVDEDDIFLFRFSISPSPLNVDPYGIGLLVDPDYHTVVAERT